MQQQKHGQNPISALTIKDQGSASHIENALSVTYTALLPKYALTFNLNNNPQTSIIMTNEMKLNDLQIDLYQSFIQELIQELPSGIKLLTHTNWPMATGLRSDLKPDIHVGCSLVFSSNDPEEDFSTIYQVISGILDISFELVNWTIHDNLLNIIFTF